MDSRRYAATVLVSGLFACGGSTGGGAGGAGGTAQSGAALPCDVDAVLAASCRSCHGATPSYGAPMALVTYEDLVKPAVTDKSKKVYELVQARIHDDAHPMPQPPAKRLDAADTATIDAWVAAKAPAAASGQKCGGAGGSGAGGGTTIACTPDIHVTSSAAWTMPKDKTDDYVCYGFDVAAGDRKNIIGFVPHIDNKKIVHHVLLYQTATSESSVPTECQGTVSVGQSKKLIYAWAPGGVAFQLPDEAGFPMDATSHFYVQLHYNNIQGLVGETDSSGFDLCTTKDARANEADMVGFGTVSFSLPPHATTARDCTYQWPANAGAVHAIAAFPHMHKLGASIATRRDPQGKAEDLGHNAPWDFNNQPFMPIDAMIQPGDTIETRCEWNNTTANTVNFGETTEDEMCFSFTMYYPKSPAFKSWIKPSIASKCQ